MRSKVFMLITGMLILCMVGAIVFLDNGASPAPAHASPNVVPSSPGLGVPAIQPTLAGGTVRYSTTDVEAFIKANPAPPDMTLEIGWCYF